MLWWVRPPLLLVLLLPWPFGRDLDLFGGRELPVGDLDAWKSGVAPSSVRSYLRDEIKSRGLRPCDVARRLGISRPQLVNILRGRFGAGSLVTLRLKDFALCLDAEIDDPAQPLNAVNLMRRGEGPVKFRTRRPLCSQPRDGVH